MTILYKVESKDGNKGGVYPQKHVLCSISAKNVAAFSVYHEKENASFGTAARSGFNNHVYVCDIVAPWQHYKVCSAKAEILVLEWSPTAEHILLGYRGGNIEIWAPKNHSLNNWALVYTANIPSEDIIYAKFFHNGKGVFFNSQKRDSTFYAEKFERLDQRPSLLGFGGVATDGFIVVTASGLLGCVTIPKLNPPINAGNDNAASQASIDLPVSTHSIGLSRNYVAHCCMSYSASGALNFAINCGWQEQLINCFKVSLKLDGEDRIAMKSETQPSIFLDSLKNRTISHIKMTRIGAEDVIFIAYVCIDGSSLLEQWNLTRRHQSVHALLHQNKGEFIQCESWEQNAKVHFPAGISDICTSKMMSDFVQIYAILKDNSVQVLEPGLKKSNVLQLDRYTDERQTGIKYSCGDLTHTNQVLFVFDNKAQITALQMPNPHIEKSHKLAGIALQAMLLEYCVVTGADASDLLILNLNNLDALIEKLTDNFARQPAFTRHYYYSNFLALKSNICRIQSKQHDFDNLIILHSISITFKSLLRPSDLGCQDKGPAENLAMRLSEPTPDVDTVLLNLDAKDFTVEPITLQSLQQLIQWVADLALNMLNKLPEEILKTKMCKRQGYDISRDIVAINSIRELLVMIRIWGLLNPQCLPIYTKTTDNIDVLSILFRLLTRLAQNTAEPDEVLLDECFYLLSKQVLNTPRQNDNPTTLLSAYLVTNKPMMLMFSAQTEPPGFQEIKMEEVIFPSGTRDGVSNIQLGSKVKPIRKCARCGFVNSINKVTKTSALKAWCNKWQYCHCGGFWKMVF